MPVSRLAGLLSVQVDHMQAAGAPGLSHWKRLSRSLWTNVDACLAPDRCSGLTFQSMPQRLQVAATVLRAAVDVTVSAHQLRQGTHRVLLRLALVHLPAQRRDVHSDSSHRGTLMQFLGIHLGTRRPIPESEV